MIVTIKFIDFNLSQDADEESFSENRQLLQTFTLCIVKTNGPINESVPQAILRSLLPLGETLLTSVSGETGGFPEVMVVMHTLAACGSGSGHMTLFKSATTWLQYWYDLTLTRFNFVQCFKYALSWLTRFYLVFLCMFQ